jgi:hypothetical protein
MYALDIVTEFPLLIFDLNVSAIKILFVKLLFDVKAQPNAFDYAF